MSQAQNASAGSELPVAIPDRPAVGDDEALAEASIGALWLVLGGMASGGFAALAARSIEMTTTLAIMAGGVLGGLIASALVVRSIVLPARRARKARRWLVRALGNLSRTDREQEFRVLLEAEEARELHDVARACYDAMRMAHCDRLEAAALRRELDHRVEKRTRVAVAHLTKISSTDELTGLLNRRGFDRALCELWNDAAERGLELALIAIDLDKFKDLNDALGHDAGDTALRAVGETLRSGLREGDIAGRIGGDELMVCLRGSDGATAQNVAERFMSSYRMHPSSTGSTWPTMSIGIACGGEHGATSPEHLRRMADEALYAAKRGGRSACVVHQPTRTRSAA